MPSTVSLNDLSNFIDLLLNSFGQSPSQIKYLMIMGLSKPYCLLSLSNSSGVNSLLSPKISDEPVMPLSLVLLAFLSCRTALSNGPSGAICRMKNTMKNMANAVGIINNKRLITYSNILFFFI